MTGALKHQYGILRGDVGASWPKIRIESMSKNYILIFLKNTGATTKCVAPTPPPTKRVALTLLHLISEYYYILI